MKIYIETMGCPKNISDSQRAKGYLLEANYEIVSTPEDANCVMVNTCGFIDDAKKESIDKIFELANTKEEKAKLIVSGCLSQRYGQELYEEMPEVDCFIGVNEYEKLPGILDEMMITGERILKNDGEAEKVLEKVNRSLEENPYTATIKISEGCNNFCTYCIIPKIRGKFRSKREEDIIAEAKELASNGCKELILIGQDLTYYGKDLYGEFTLSKLLKKVCKIEGIEWIRLMYCYEDKITDELIETIATEDKICKYIDIPIQHSSDKVLKEMNRKSNRAEIVEVLNKLKTQIPNMHIRTTLITGFPGENEDDYLDLLDFIESQEFQRLGAFAYSKEEGTVAAKRIDQIPEEIKLERLDGIMRRQQEISLRKNEEKIGKEYKVLIDEIEEDGTYIGRTEYDAPEIDNTVIFTSTKKHNIGEFVNVEIIDAYDYDLVGKEI